MQATVRLEAARARLAGVLGSVREARGRAEGLGFALEGGSAAGAYGEAVARLREHLAGLEGAMTPLDALVGALWEAARAREAALAAAAAGAGGG